MHRLYASFPKAGVKIGQAEPLLTVLDSERHSAVLEWSSMERLLLIDDDPELCDLVQRFLADEGFSMDFASNGAEGLRRSESAPYALILLDVMLPHVDGFDVLRRIRATSRVPVLMLTAKGDTRDRVLGLELGADDYLPKPFDPAELAARVRAILRRAAPAAVRLSIGDMEVNAGARTVHKHGEPVDLTTVEFTLLTVLMRSAGVGVSREQLCREVLGREFTPFDRSIDTHVYNLRKKIGVDRIKGIRGTGYLYTVEAI
jgi:two-component system response regulator CpxR